MAINYGKGKNTSNYNLVASQILQQLLANLILYSYLCPVVNFYTAYLIHMTADW